LARGILHSPRMVRDLFWLAKRTAIARQHLSRVLQRWAATFPPPHLYPPPHGGRKK
jgi:hypothetical protein